MKSKTFELIRFFSLWIAAFTLALVFVCSLLFISQKDKISQSQKEISNEQ